MRVVPYFGIQQVYYHYAGIDQICNNSWWAGAHRCGWKRCCCCFVYNPGWIAGFRFNWSEVYIKLIFKGQTLEPSETIFLLKFSPHPNLMFRFHSTIQSTIVRKIIYLVKESLVSFPFWEISICRFFLPQC